MDIQTRGFSMLSIQAFIRNGPRDSVVSGLLFSNPGYVQCSIVQVNKAFYILHRTSHTDFDFINSVEVTILK